jgi:membrane-anchored glycerophosphoryl diester phosphodiesterase (GDPDase)
MWLTRFLTGFCVIFGLLLLIIPGIYLAIRLALAEPVAVCERVSGSTAMTRSLQLTKGRFWNMLLLVLAFVAVIVAALACVILPVVFVPALDHWLVDAITALVCDIIAAFGILCMLCAYVAFSTDQNLAEPSTAPNDAPATSVDNPGVTEGPPSVS